MEIDTPLHISFPLPHPSWAVSQGSQSPWGRAANITDGHISNSFKHMPRHMPGISCHRPLFVKHIHLDDTLHHLDCIISSLLSLRSSEQHVAIGLGPCANKPVVTLALCRAHTHTAGKGLVLSPSHCEPLDSVRSEWGAPSVHHLRWAN